MDRTSAAAILKEPLSGRQRSLLVLLIISIFLNYIDRGSLSVAVPVLEKDLALGPAQLGHLLGAFFWTYALFQLFGIAGWLADRFPVGSVLTFGFVIWSVATLASGFVTGFAGLFAARLVLGAGESVAYPCYSRILSSEIPQHRRGLANALLDAGSKMGPGLGSLLGGLLLARFGWRAFFIVLGAGSLIWIVPWMRSTRHIDGSVGLRASQNAPTIRAILSQRSAWGSFLGHFCGNYFWFFLLTWLPGYLVRERQFTLIQMAEVSSLAYVLMAVGTILAGWFSDSRIRAGDSPTRVRKAVVVTGLTLSTVILPVAVITDVRISIAFLLASCIAFGVYTSNHWAITQTLAGPLAAGRWTSLQNGIGNLSGIAAAWLTGVVVQETGRFHAAFVVAAGIVLLAAIFWGAVVGRVEPVQWPEGGVRSA